MLLWSILVGMFSLMVGASYTSRIRGLHEVGPDNTAVRIPTHQAKSTFPKPVQSIPARAPQHTIQPLANPQSDLIPTIAAALRTGNASDKELVLTKLLPELMQTNMPAAAKLAEALEPWAWREETLQRVARVWALSNPDRATNWALRLPIASERNSILNQICISLAEQDPQRAMGIAQQCGFGISNSVLIESIAHHWAVEDFASALQWTERLSSRDLRDKAYAQLALVQSKSAPAVAADLVVERISPGPIQTESAISVLHQWILRDPTGAASWVKLFPPGEVRQRAEDELEGVARYRQPGPSEG